VYQIGVHNRENGKRKMVRVIVAAAAVPLGWIIGVTIGSLSGSLVTLTLTLKIVVVVSVPKGATRYYAERLLQ
jgi:hypothetical protein